MSSFVTKLMATGAALSIGISTFAVANFDYNGQFNNNCCPPVASCPVPVYDPCCTNWCDNFSFDASWLYWKASGDDFHYAVERERFVSGSAGGGSDLFTSRQKIHDMNFDWDSGFRLGFGLNLPCQGWGVYVDWTHFDTSSSSKTHVEGLSPGDVTAGLPVVGGFVTDILDDGQSADFKGHVKLRYNTVDIELGKWCNCDCCFSFRPHVGLRLADIQERFRVHARGNGSGPGTGNAVLFDGDFTAGNFHHKNRFKGAGIRVGLDTNLCLCEGWSFIGRGALSSIWGTTHLRNLFRTSTISVIDESSDFVREDYRQTRFITDLSLGIRWKTMACGCYPLTLEFAWEHHYLFNQHKYWVDNSFALDGPPPFRDRASSLKSKGDVAFQGLTLTAGFDF